MPLALTDSEMRAILDAAAPVQRQDRDQFLRDIADALAKCPAIGDGTVHRIVAELQRQYIGPRAFPRSGVGKWR